MKILAVGLNVNLKDRENEYICNLVGGSSNGKSFYMLEKVPVIRIPVSGDTEFKTEIYRFSHKTYLRNELWYNFVREEINE